MKWIVAIVLVVPVAVVGLLNLVCPRVTTRWRIAAKAKRQNVDPFPQVGRFFERMLGVMPGREFERGSLRRVQLFGIAGIAVSVGVVLVAKVYW